MPSYSLPEVNIYPNNQWGDIARKRGLQTARDWRAVKSATTEGINNFGSSIANPLYTASSFLPVVGDSQDIVDFYQSYKDDDKLGMTLSAIGLIPGIGNFATGINKIRKVQDLLQEVNKLPKEQRNQARLIIKQNYGEERLKQLTSEVDQLLQYRDEYKNEADRLRKMMNLSHRKRSYDSYANNLPKIYKSTTFHTSLLSPKNKGVGFKQYLKYLGLDTDNVSIDQKLPLKPFNTININISGRTKDPFLVENNEIFDLPVLGTNKRVSGSLNFPRRKVDLSYTVERNWLPNYERFEYSNLEPGQIIQSEKNTKYIPNDTYLNALRNNIKYVQQRLPELKLFGSSVGVSEVGLPHATHDIDGFMTDTQFAKYNNNLTPYRVDRNGIPQTYSLNLGEAGDIDVNVINRDPKTGFAIGENALELYRQNFPSEYYSQTLKQARLAKNGIDEPLPVVINKTPEELLEKFNPYVKTINDSFEVPYTFKGKEKHEFRPLAYLAYGDPNKVHEGLMSWAKSNFSANVQIPNINRNAFLDSNANKNLLKELGLEAFVGTNDVVENPDRMRNLLTYKFLNDTVSGRSVNRGKLASDATVYDAVTTWNSDSLGGNWQGAGLNTIKNGNAGGFYGHIHSALQPKINNIDNVNSLEDVRNLFKSIGKQFGEGTVSESDLKVMKPLLDEYNIYPSSINNYKDLLEELPSDGKDAEDALKYLSDNLKMDAITGDFHNQNGATGLYRSMIRPINKPGDVVAIGTNRLASLDSRLNDVWDDRLSYDLYNLVRKSVYRNPNFSLYDRDIKNFSNFMNNSIDNKVRDKIDDQLFSTKIKQAHYGKLHRIFDTMIKKSSIYKKTKEKDIDIDPDWE